MPIEATNGLSGSVGADAVEPSGRLRLHLGQARGVGLLFEAGDLPVAIEREDAHLPSRRPA